ncbi:MAG TPA: zf-HC2 domain-containing protein [Noviherbaspirillum sp.]|jgi:predicted anti-sigma-YlaC factor YlaD|uniref:zf-HC2 domain-containing protein n=1 Tax=Noviherbaspirillum sp. TaxID=1926288 RepID=UPI002DDDBB41|nr:zf-HC2 domain-containing protein [Noviherbaspirillum sp.]HEV2611125.1 zf-HC2 domain-containing protein [Noviherbaspirillum sp.]
MGLKPTCREVHRLTSEGLDRPLTWTERARVHIHLGVCSACTNFANQMKLIRTAMRQLTIPEAADSDSEKK